MNHNCKQSGKVSTRQKKASNRRLGQKFYKHTTDLLNHYATTPHHSHHHLSTWWMILTTSQLDQRWVTSTDGEPGRVPVGYRRGSGDTSVTEFWSCDLWDRSGIVACQVCSGRSNEGNVSLSIKFCVALLSREAWKKHTICHTYCPELIDNLESTCCE